MRRAASASMKSARDTPAISAARPCDSSPRRYQSMAAARRTSACTSVGDRWSVAKGRMGKGTGPCACPSDAEVEELVRWVIASTSLARDLLLPTYLPVVVSLAVLLLVSG